MECKAQPCVHLFMHSHLQSSKLKQRLTQPPYIKIEVSAEILLRDDFFQISKLSLFVIQDGLEHHWEEISVLEEIFRKSFCRCPP